VKVRRARRDRINLRKCTEVGFREWQRQIAHNLAKSEGPLPLAVVTMLGLP
jgi:hypothetical protein